MEKEREVGEKRERKRSFLFYSGLFGLWLLVRGTHRTETLLRETISSVSCYDSVSRIVPAVSPRAFVLFESKRKKKENIRIVRVKYVRVKILYEEKKL